MSKWPRTDEQFQEFARGNVPIWYTLRRENRNNKGKLKGERLQYYNVMNDSTMKWA